MTKVIDTTAMTNETLGKLVSLLNHEIALQSDKIDYLAKHIGKLNQLIECLVEMTDEMEVTLYAPAGLAPKQ